MVSILLVDDDKSLLDLGKEFLEEGGQHTIITANSVDEAMMYIGSTPIDVIVSDYQMPDKNGIEFLIAIRDRKEKIPFILFTGKGREEVVIEAINEGVDFYIRKDVDIKSQYAQLLHTIEQAYKRKQAEDAVDYNLSLFKQLIENSTDIIIMVDEKGIIEYVSPSVTRVLGYQESDIIGQDGLRFLKPEMQTFVKQNYIDGIEQITSTHDTFETRKKDGSWAIIEYVTRAVYRNGHKKVIVNLEDITERVEKEQQLQILMREIESQHDEVLKESENGIIGGIDYNISTSKVNLTPLAAKVLSLGESTREIDMRVLEMMVHPEDRGLFNNVFANASRTPEPVKLSFRIAPSSGGIRHIDLISCTMMDKDSAPTHMHGVIRDCTEAVRLNEKIMNATRCSD
jgi:PAS domain S-box-containing protein